MRDQGAGYSPLQAAIWRGWAAVYSTPALYRAVSWLGSRLRALTPRRQGGWTSVRTPLQPAPQRLRDLMKQRH